MPYDPTFPIALTRATADAMRAQLNALKAIIDAVPAGPKGDKGDTGEPFAQAVVDGVSLFPHGSLPTVTLAFDGVDVHFTFGIPAGAPGADGLPGEVTTAQMNDAISNALVDRPTITAMTQAIADAVATRTTLVQVQAEIGGSLADRPTTLQVQEMIETSSSGNTNSVATIDSAFGDPDLDVLRQKVNELIVAARRV